MTAALAEVPVRVRRMEPGDIAFVLETSLKVRKPHTSSWSEWRDAQRETFRADLQSESTHVSVMESDGVLVGFAWWHGDALRMLYVKRDLRGNGWGLALLGGWPEAGMVEVWKPNSCWRRWAFVRSVRWKEAV